MKKIKFTCPNCHAKLRVATHLAGVTAPCPKCGVKIMAPTDFENFTEEISVESKLITCLLYTSDAADES